jgi:hypothetical protein
MTMPLHAQMPVPDRPGPKPTPKRMPGPEEKPGSVPTKPDYMPRRDRPGPPKPPKAPQK